MPGIDAWCALADEAVATGGAMPESVGDSLVRIGMTVDEHAELIAALTGREDPAALLLRRVAEEAQPSSEPTLRPTTPTDAQMDAALAVSGSLLRTPAETAATQLASLDTRVLAALPPDAAGQTVHGLLRKAQTLGQQGDDASALGLLRGVADLAASVSPTRLPVSEILSATAGLGAADPEIQEKVVGQVSRILARVPTTRLLSGVAEALHQGVDGGYVSLVLDQAARIRETFRTTAPAGAATEPSAAPQPQPMAPPWPPQPVPKPPRTTWRGIDHVTDTAEPASPTPAAAVPAPTTAASRTAYPRLDVDSHQARPDVVVIDEPFDVTVGLAKRKDVTLTQTGRMSFASGVETQLDIVLVFDPTSLVPQGDTHLTLTVSDADPYPSTTVSFVPQWGPDDDPLPPERRIGAHYLVGGQLVGIAWRSVVAVDSASKVANAPQPSTREPALLDLAPLLGDDLPDLIVTVCNSDGRNDGQFVWTAYAGASGAAVPDGPRMAQLDGDLAGFVVEMRRAIQFSKGGSDDYLELAGRARRIGQAIPRAVARAIREVVGDPARTTAPSILLLTEELALPWELASLDPPFTTTWGGVSPFLGAHAAIGRWPLSEHKPRPTPRASVAVRRAAVLTANYEGVQGWGKLDNALKEATDIAGLFDPRAVEVRPAVWDVVDLLRGTPPADLLHVALHGQFDAQGGQEGLVLLGTDSGGQLTAQWRFLTPVEVENGSLDGGPFVFLNACQVASDKRVLGDYGGFASTLLRIGASGVVAPLWNVDDDVAASVARGFYAATWSTRPGGPGRVSAAEAIRAVRARYTEAAVRAQTPGVTATLVAFQVYGHPRLQLTSEA